MAEKLAFMVGFMAVLAMASGLGQAKTIRFSGYDWTVRSAGRGGPGPNEWDESNAWVDDRGSLHLKLAPRDEKWYCSEVSTAERLGFGRYQFWIEGRVDTLDLNVVLGLFNYPTRDVGRGGTREIDIEFAKWGLPKAPIGNYTVWPTERTLKSTSSTFPITLDGELSTQRFTWSPTTVFFQSLLGHRDDDAQQVASWRYEPADPARRISQQAMPVHINLWCFEGRPPTDGRPVEVVVRAFTFTPLPAAAAPEAPASTGTGAADASDAAPDSSPARPR
jgi:hypothetical protein